LTDRAPEVAAAAALALAACAVAVMTGGAARDDAGTPRAAAFHRSAGGLGWGAATSLASCGASFDRSSGVACDLAFDPAPGGTSFCVLHAGPSLRR
jgi:hypothetical protein